MAVRDRIGVFGGSFDPVHVGHLVLAVNALRVFRLDRVLMVVAGEPWQKVGERNITPASVRLAAVEAAVRDVPGLEASDIEVTRSGPSYTVDTLRLLHDQQPSAELFLILGADAAARLDTWREPDAVAELAELIVANRPGSPRASLGPPWNVHALEIPPLEVSSSDLRHRLAVGLPVDFLVPKEALAFFRPAP